MRKKQHNRLDPFAERLDQWFGAENLSLAEAQKKLWEDCNIRVSSQALSAWWSRRQSQLMEEQLLDRIATGARQCQDVERKFAKNPAPELDTIIKLLRVLILKLSAQANVDPAVFKVITNVFHPVLEYYKLQDKKKDRELTERRVALLEKKAAAFDQAAKAVETAGGLTPETLEKIQRELKLL